MAKNPFNVAADPTQIQTPTQRAPDRTQDILREGQAAAQITQAVGSAAGSVAKYYADEKEKSNQVDWSYTINDVGNASKDTLMRMKAARNKDEVRALAQGFQDSLTDYPARTNDSGELYLKDQSTRTKFVREYAPQAQANMEAAMNARLFEIDQLDRNVKYNTTRKNLITSAASPQDVINAEKQISILDKANLSTEQAKIATKEAVQQAAQSSIFNQMDAMANAPGATVEGVTQMADALKVQSSTYDLPEAQQTLINQQLDQTVSRFKSRKASELQADKKALENSIAADENNLYGMLRTVDSDQQQVGNLFGQYHDVVDALARKGPAGQKRARSFEKMWRESASGKLRPNTPAAMGHLDALENNTNTTTESLRKWLDKYVASNDINATTAAQKYSKYAERLTGTQKRIKDDFMQSLLNRAVMDEPVSFEVEGFIRDDTVEFLDPASITDRDDKLAMQKQYTQLGLWVDEYLKVNPEPTPADLEKAFGAQIVSLAGKGAQLSLKERINQSKENWRMRGEETKFKKEGYQKRREARIQESGNFFQMLQGASEDRFKTTPKPETSE